MIARSGSIEDAMMELAKFRKDLRNRRKSASNTAPEWARVMVTGFAELAAICRDDVPLLSSGWAEMLPDLPVVGEAADMWWVLHAHLSVHHPGLSRRQVGDVLRKQWPGARRVHVKAMYAENTCADNAANIQKYAVKLGGKNRLQGVEVAWPTRWTAEQWLWVYRKRAGLKSLSITMSAIRNKNSPDLVDADRLDAPPKEYVRLASRATQDKYCSQPLSSAADILKSLRLVSRIIPNTRSISMNTNKVFDFLREKEREMQSHLAFRPAATFALHMRSDNEEDNEWRGAAARWLVAAEKHNGICWRLRTMQDDETDVRTVFFDVEDADHAVEFQRTFQGRVHSVPEVGCDEWWRLSEARSYRAFPTKTTPDPA